MGFRRMGVACHSSVMQPVEVTQAKPVQRRIMPAPVPQRHPNYDYKGSAHIPPVERIDPEILKNTGYNILWNQRGWLDYENHQENSPELFHKKIEDYIHILHNTPNLDPNARWRVERFLKGQYIYPQYKKPPPSKRQHNYYRLLWHILHSLPFYIRSYDQRTISAISYFYDDVATTHPCNVCSTHMTKYLKDNPINASSLADYVVWMCNFHNYLNTETGKPWFDCTKYAKRWGIKLSKVQIAKTLPPAGNAAQLYSPNPAQPQPQPVRPLPTVVYDEPLYERPVPRMVYNDVIQSQQPGPNSQVSPYQTAMPAYTQSQNALPVATVLTTAAPYGSQPSQYYQEEQKSVTPRSSQNSDYQQPPLQASYQQPYSQNPRSSYRDQNPRGSQVDHWQKSPPSSPARPPVRSRQRRFHTAPDRAGRDRNPKRQSAGIPVKYDGRVQDYEFNSRRAKSSSRRKFKSIEEIPMFPE